MRLTRLLALFLTSGLLPFAAQAADAPPQRLYGLWEINVSGGQAAPYSVHLCVGQQDDIFAHVEGVPTDCAQARWTRDGVWRVGEASCPTGTLGARLSGDFEYNFQGELSLPPAQAGGEARRLEIDGRRLAPCKALKPGEAERKGSKGRNLNLGQ